MEYVEWRDVDIKKNGLEMMGIQKENETPTIYVAES